MKLIKSSLLKASLPIAIQVLTGCSAFPTLANGFYQNPSVGKFSDGLWIPDYSLYVDEGKVNGDFSDDDFGCHDRQCDYKTIVSKVIYLSLGSDKLLRITPSGSFVILTREAKISD